MQFHRRGGDGRYIDGSGGYEEHPTPSYSQQPVDYMPQFNSQNPAPYAQYPPQAYQYNPYIQNPNYMLQDPNLLLLLQLISTSLSMQYYDNVASSYNVDYSQYANFPTQMATPEQKPNPPPQNQSQELNRLPSRNETLKKIEVAVNQARRELVTSGRNVSTWKVIESAMLKLKVDSWDSLGFQFQQVPILHSLIVLEGKVNAFIHCFVAVRTITSLYDLQVAICENEGVKNFEELELGPLLRHPLIEHYFLSKDMTEVYSITGEKIIAHLKKYICREKQGKNIDDIGFLKYLARRCKVHTWEKMGLRIQSLGTHIEFVRSVHRQENSMKKAFLDKEKDSGKKTIECSLFSLEKKQMDQNNDGNKPFLNEEKGSSKKAKKRPKKQIDQDNDAKKSFPDEEKDSNKKGKKCPLFSPEKQQIDQDNDVKKPFLHDSSNKKGKKRPLFSSEKEQIDQDNDVKKPFLHDSSTKKGKKRPLISLEKKKIDEHYDDISQRVASFSYAHKDFCGKHIRFDSSSSSEDELTSSKSKKKKEPLCWAPDDWKTAPGFEYGAEINEKKFNEDSIIQEAVLPETSSFPNDNNSIVFPNNVVIESHCPAENYSRPTQTVLNPDAQKAVYAGRLGEYLAFTHLKEKHGAALVRWMNEQNESCLPYDISIGDQENGKEFFEVKTTRYASKNWFKISNREWQSAVEKGDKYSLAHVILSNTENAKITIYQNPVKLCQQGKLELNIAVPKQYPPSLPSVAPQ